MGVLVSAEVSRFRDRSLTSYARIRIDPGTVCALVLGCGGGPETLQSGSGSTRKFQTRLTDELYCFGGLRALLRFGINASSDGTLVTNAVGDMRTPT